MRSQFLYPAHPQLRFIDMNRVKQAKVWALSTTRDQQTRPKAGNTAFGKRTIDGRDRKTGAIERPNEPAMGRANGTTRTAYTATIIPLIPLYILGSTTYTTVHITLPWGSFPSSIARSRGCQYGTARLRKALSELFPTPTVLAPT